MADQQEAHQEDEVEEELPVVLPVSTMKLKWANGDPRRCSDCPSYHFSFVLSKGVVCGQEKRFFSFHICSPKL